MNHLDKDTLFMSMACLAAMASKDTSTKVGAVIVGQDDEVISIGYNGFPRKTDDSNKLKFERPTKYYWTEHAERNAIFNAARIGVNCKGSRMYTPFYPCPDCARGIIQSGIQEIIVHSKFAPKLVGSHTLEEDKLNATFRMLKEACVGIRGIDIEIPTIEIMVAGKKY